MNEAPETSVESTSTASPERLAEKLATVLSNRLQSVVLYGSAAAGDFVPGISNFNLLVIVDPLGIEELNLLSPAISEWSKDGHPNPLFFTPQQLADSLDAFPIEMLDIQQSRRALWGHDLLAEIRVDPAHLRRQVERELTGKLLKLRGRYLVTERKPQAVEDLMLRSLSTFLVLFRAALRLYQNTVPDTKLDALRALSEHIPFDTQPFVRLSELKRRSGEGRSTVPEVSFQSYLAAIECVAGAVNKFTQPIGSK
jgi:hypothetical protein